MANLSNVQIDYFTPTQIHKPQGNLIIALHCIGLENMAFFKSRELGNIFAQDPEQLWTSVDQTCIQRVLKVQKHIY
jgi:hypothetical protein